MIMSRLGCRTRKRLGALGTWGRRREWGEEEERRGMGGMRKTQKTKHKYEGIDLRQSPCWTAAKPEPIAHPGWRFPQFRTRLAQGVEWKK